MTRVSGARISFALLLVALVVAWRISKPVHRSHPPRTKPVAERVAAPRASDTRPIGPSVSSPVSLPVEPDASRPATRAATTTRKLWFHVTTLDGAPIAGACAQPLSVPVGVVKTDAEGNGLIESRKPIPTIRVTAPGYELLEVPVPPEADSLEVKLRAAAMLTIRVTTSAGAPCPEWLTVTVETPWPFSLGPMINSPLWRALGNSEPVGGSLPSAFAQRGLPQEVDRAPAVPAAPRRLTTDFRENPVRLSPVQPGIPISVFVRTVLGDEPVTREVELASGEWRVLDLVIPGEFGRLSGRVVSSSGAPMPNANVTVARPGATRASKAEAVPLSGGWSSPRNQVSTGEPPNFASLTTDVHGAFDFGAVPAGVFELSVEMADHAAWVSKEHRVTRNAAPLTITMDSGVSITVKLVDADGRPLSGASVWAVDRARKSDAEGKVRFEHLPRGLVSFDTFFGGVRTSFSHDTSIPDPTFQIQVINR